MALATHNLGTKLMCWMSSFDCDRVGVCSLAVCQCSDEGLRREKKKENCHQSLKTLVPFSANALTRFALGIIPCSVNDGVTGFSLAPLSAIRPQLLCGLGSLSQAST